MCFHPLGTTRQIDMVKNKAGCDDDDGDGGEEADYEEEDVVAEVLTTVPGWTTAVNDKI